MSDLPERIRAEAAIADRPGQMKRLEAIALEVDALESGEREIHLCGSRCPDCSAPRVDGVFGEARPDYLALTMTATLARIDDRHNHNESVMDSPGCDRVAPPAGVEVLAEEFYLAVMQASADQWVEWQNAPQSVRSGYYDLAYEVAEKVREASR